MSSNVDTQNNQSDTRLEKNNIKRSKVEYSKINFTEEEKELIRNEVDLIKEKYPNYIPIVVRTNPKDKIEITKTKFLVGQEITLGQFLLILRKKIKNVKSTEAIYLMINNTLVPITTQLSLVYNDKKDKETNMLFITICKENTFG